MEKPDEQKHDAGETRGPRGLDHLVDITAALLGDAGAAIPNDPDFGHPIHNQVMGVAIGETFMALAALLAVPTLAHTEQKGVAAYNMAISDMAGLIMRRPYRESRIVASKVIEKVKRLRSEDPPASLATLDRVVHHQQRVGEDAAMRPDDTKYSIATIRSALAICHGFAMMSCRLSGNQEFGRGYTAASCEILTSLRFGLFERYGVKS